MWRDGGDGAGVCEDNPCTNPQTGARGNGRKQNEDRGLAMTAPDYNDAAATAFLENAFNQVNTATREIYGGSTLSAVMATTDGNYACAHLGDSPIYVLGYNPSTKTAKLVQMNIPHNLDGNYTFMSIPDDKKNEEISFDTARQLHDNRPVPPSSQIFAYLGNTSFSKRDERDDPYSPEFRAITPHKHLPEGFQFKGMMVCSDGVQLSDENNHLTREAAEKALSVLFANNNTPDPQEIAQAMVSSAMPDPNDPHFKHSNDNITAVFLPAGGKGLIAVADGNNGTAKVAITALDVLHEQCIAGPPHENISR